MKRLVLLGALMLAGNTPPTGAPIEVTVTGLRSDQGMVRVSVCPANLFLKTCPWGASAPAHRGGVTIIVNGVPPGHYAVQAFHDADANNKLGQYWFGLPKEGIGFSNDAMPRMIMPRFSVAAFDHGPAPQRIPITVRYFLS